MVSKISYFVIFEIIVFTQGSPAYSQDSYKEPQYDLKKILGEIVKQGKYNVILNHHEDRPGTHHEDITQLTYNGGKPNSRYNNEKYRNEESYQGSSGKNLKYNSLPSRTNIQNLNLFLRKKPTALRTADETNTGQTNENADDVLTFLNDLDNTLKLNRGSDLQLRCSGNRCGGNNADRAENNNENRDNNENIINDNDRHLRCNGQKCSIVIENDRNDRDNFRCQGNRCSRSGNDRDDNDVDDRYDDNRATFNIIRCDGDRCGINRDDDDDDDNDDDREGIYTLRCVGDRCGINRDDDDDDDNDDRVGIDTLRCVGDLCSINRDDDDDDDDDDDKDTLRCIGNSCSRNRNDDYAIETLRCVGDRCSRNRDDDRDDDRNDRNDLRCVGDRCSRNRDDDRDDDRNDRNDLRCVGDRCSKNRDDDRDDDRNDRNDLRCVGDRCSRNRDDDDDDARDNLRCIGNRCGRSRNDYEHRDQSHESQDEVEAEEIVDNLLSNYANSRGNDYSLPEGSNKRNVMKQVKSLLSNLKNGLIQVVHRAAGLKPPADRPANL